ncbi:MAG: pentapeptide repeat-containing protein [Pirellulales bacterium]|nr:pentapeptide repeat-containing protein [Pirellulales bacterium]
MNWHELLDPISSGRLCLTLLRSMFLRTVELGTQRTGGHRHLAPLPAAARSPSELRRRVAGVLGEPLREPLPFSCGTAVALLAIAMLLGGGVLSWPTAAQTNNAASRVDSRPPAAEAGGTDHLLPNTADANQPRRNGSGGPASPEGSPEKPRERGEWLDTLRTLTQHNQMAFVVGPRMLAELSANDAFEVVRQAWPNLQSDDVKTGLLKTFEFARNPRVLDVLDLGARDPSPEVRKYARSYLRNYAMRDFPADEHEYAAWRAKHAGQPVDRVLQENARWLVAKMKNTEPPDDQRWWIELDMMLNLGGSKSSYPKKAMYLRDAGLVQVLQSWLEAPSSGPHVKRGAAAILADLTKACLPATEPNQQAALRGAALSGLLLDKGVDRLLAGADLRESNSSGATLVGGMKAFYETDFSGADLTGSILIGRAAFQKAVFRNANLAGAVLKGDGSDFQMASFEGANLTGARLTGGGSSFQASSFVGANLTAARLQGAGPAFQCAKFDNANVSLATIRCDSVTAFQMASLNNAEFSAADLSTIDATALASCVFAPKTPPEYSVDTRFPKGFDPASKGWRQTKGEKNPRADAAAPKDTEQKPEKKPLVLRGRVADDRGKPIPGVQVVLFGGVATRWRGQETMTNTNGEYRFDPFSTGAKVFPEKGEPQFDTGVRFLHPEYVPADGNSWRDIRVPGVPGREDVLDMIMTRGGKVRGTVLDAQSGRAAAGLSLQIYNGFVDGTENGTYHTYATTAADGTFSSDPLFPGRYVIEISDQARSKIGKAVVRAGEIVALEMTTRERPDLQDPFRITGSAIGDDGQSMCYGGVGVRIPGDKHKIRQAGGGIDGTNEFHLTFGPVDRIEPSATAPFGIGTHDVELFGSNRRFGYKLLSRTPSEPLRITDDPNHLELKDGIRYIRPNQPIEFKLIFAKENQPVESRN